MNSLEITMLVVGIFAVVVAARIAWEVRTGKQGPKYSPEEETDIFRAIK
jgi:hypothetical protein